MADGQHVLLIDGLSETEAVLKAVLEPRGHRVQRVREPEADGETGPEGRPNVLIVHERTAPADDWPNVPRIVIGSAEVDDANESGGAHHLQFPFHYRELVQAIERLLNASQAE